MLAVGLAVPALLHDHIFIEPICSNFSFGYSCHIHHSVDLTRHITSGRLDSGPSRSTVRSLKSSSTKRFYAMDSSQSACVDADNSTDCLLRALLDAFNSQTDAFDWDPLNFAFTLVVGVAALFFAAITLCQAIMSGATGRRRCSKKVIGIWAKKKENQIRHFRSHKTLRRVHASLNPPYPPF